MRQIDRRASARLSLAFDRDEFVVRDLYAEEATHVVLVEDTRPSMRLYPAGLPWLRKPVAVAETLRLLAASAPRSRCQFRRSPTRDLAACLDVLVRARLASGSFVFVVSDFLDCPLPDLLTVAGERRWDLIPVVVQDATWERSFPDVARMPLRIFDPEDAAPRPAYLTRRECRSLRAANEQRFSNMLSRARDHGLDPIVLSSHRHEDVYRQFCEWVEARRTRQRRRC